MLRPQGQGSFAGRRFSLLSYLSSATLNDFPAKKVGIPGSGRTTLSTRGAGAAGFLAGGGNLRLAPVAQSKGKEVTRTWEKDLPSVAAWLTRVLGS